MLTVAEALGFNYHHHSRRIVGHIFHCLQAKVDAETKVGNAAYGRLTAGGG
jgi:hypothetical protein